MSAAALSGAAASAAVVLASPGGSRRARLTLAGLAVTPRPARAYSAGALAVPLVLGLLAGWPLPAVLLPAAGCGAAWRAAHSAAVRRRRERMATAVPDATATLAAELRSGAHPAAALAAAAEGVPALAGVLSEAALRARTGGSAAEVLGLAATDHRVTALSHLAAAWAAVEEAGVAVAGVLERLGAAMDVEQDGFARMRAQLAGPRATAVLLAGLPMLGVALGQAVGADPFGFLLGRPLGWALCGGAAVLDGLGVAWTARIVRGVVGVGRSP